MTIKTRLLLTFLVVSVLMGGSVIYVLGAQRTMNTRTEEIRQQVTVPLSHAYALKDATSWETVWSIGGVRKDAKTGLIRGNPDPTFRAEQDALFKVYENNIKQSIGALEAANLPADMKGRLANYKTNTSKLQGGIQSEFGYTTPAPIPGEPASTPAQLIPLMQERAADAGALVSYLSAVQAQQLADLEQQYDTTQRNALIALAASFGVALVAGVVLAAAIVRPVRRTVKVLEQVADGDLTPRLEPGKDEIGQMGLALNRTLDQVGEVIGAIDQSANQLAVASAAFTERSAALADVAAAVSADADAASRGVHAVTDGLASVASTTDELSRTVDEVAVTAGDAAQVASRADEVVSGTRAALRAVARADSNGNTPDQARGDAARAAGAADQLAAIAREITDLQSRIAAEVAAERAVAADISSTVATVSTSSSEADERIDNVAAAVELTSQFVDETQAEATRLADLSQTLETLTAVFTYDHTPALPASGPTPSLPPGPAPVPAAVAATADTSQEA